MKSIKNLCLLLSGFAAYAALLTGCVKQPDETSGPDAPEAGGNQFDYATTSDVKLDVDYALKGTRALFEVYDQEPVTVDENGFLKKKAEIHALLKAYTDQDSKYAGVINLPGAVTKIYLYSEAYGLPTCMAADVTPNGISFNLKDHLAKLQEAHAGKASAPETVMARSASAENPYNIGYIGDWQPRDGMPKYLLGTWHNAWAFEAEWATIPSGLLNRIGNVLMPGTNNGSYARPAEVVNIRVKKDARLKLVFLAEMAAYRSAMGYYFYETENPPRTQAEFDKLTKYIAFPNCSQLGWDAGVVGSYVPPLMPGYQLQMVYFDEQGKKSDVFPAGTTIGWFLLPDGFEVDNRGNGKLNITGSKHPIRYSNDDFNPEGARYMVSLYDKASGKTVLGFEDSGDNRNGVNDYKDVFFYVDADPADAIYDPDKPTTDPDDEKYPDVVGDPLEGTLAFEDLWPSQGDYDMNDAVIRYSTTFTTDKDNRIIAVKDVFTPLHAGGELKSAFGYQLDISASEVKNVKITNGSSTAYVTNGMEAKQDKATFLLFDDIVQAVSQGEVTVEIELNGNVSMNKVTRKSLYNPFVCVSDQGFRPGQMRKEIHLTDYAPTALADPSFFGRNDDKSSVDKEGNPTGPYYYVTSALYPFAIDLPITDYRIPDERKKMDEFYPGFPEWVTSKGEKNREWYLKPAK